MSPVTPVTRLRGSIGVLNKVQQNMQTQIKVIQTEQSKGKSATKMHTSIDELQYLLNFNQRISQGMGITI